MGIVIILRVNPIMKVKREKNLVVVVTDSTATQLPDGPYLVHSLTGETFPVSKIFHDDHLAFIGGAITSKENMNVFDWMHREVSSSNTPLFAAPFILLVGPDSGPIKARLPT